MNKKTSTFVTVGDFYAKYGEKLGMRLEGAAVGMDRRIREPTVNRPGLALAGFYSFFAGKRVQVIGGAEQSYLKSLRSSVQRERLKALFARKVPCVVVSRNTAPSRIMLEVAEAYGTPVFRSPLITKKFINAATIALEMEFSPVATEYGSMVDVRGIGVLIRGSSGIGKSECVLGLIERGYSLISDDITRFRLIEGRELIGYTSEVARFHMEVRGIGIINIATTFGAGSVRPDKRLDLVVTLKDWQEVSEIDRLGLERDSYEILGIEVPHVVIPVRMGRDLARLVEVAALDEKLRSMGQNSAQEFNQMLIQKMSGQ